MSGGATGGKRHDERRRRFNRPRCCHRSVVKLGPDLRSYPRKQETTCARHSALTFGDSVPLPFFFFFFLIPEEAGELNTPDHSQFRFLSGSHCHYQKRSTHTSVISPSSTDSGFTGWTRHNAKQKKKPLLFFVSNTIPAFVSHHTIFNATPPHPPLLPQPPPVFSCIK